MSPIAAIPSSMSSLIPTEAPDPIAAAIDYSYLA